MRQKFYVGEKRLDELKSFIQTRTSTTRFEHNSLREGDKWFVTLTMKVEDVNKLNDLYGKWYKEDTLSESPKKSIWGQILNVCRSYLKRYIFSSFPRAL